MYRQNDKKMDEIHAARDAAGEAVYVGYSMGGRLCLELAVQRPDLVEALVLVSTSPGIADDAERAARLAADRDLAAPAARLHHPASGRVLELTTDAPCLQVYTGNFLTTTHGKAGRVYEHRSGICLEPQSPPDALHHPAFEALGGSIVLEPGEVRRRRIGLRLTREG